MSKEKEAVLEVLSIIQEECSAISDLYRRKAKYKKYSKGVKSAFKNRALGLDKAVKIINSTLPYEEE